MIAVILSWITVLAIAYVFGSIFVTEKLFERMGDHFLVSIWVGLTVISNFWILLAFFIPLKFFSTMFFTFVVVVLLSIRFKIKYNFRFFKDLLRYKYFIILSFFILNIVAFLASQEVKNIDTGGYHYPIVRWLVEYGVTYGLALLQLQYGYISTWYALIAPFEAGPWQGHIGGIGAFPVFLLSLHGLLSIFRIHKGEECFSDWFILVSWFLGTSLIVLSPVVVGMSTLSTDIPIAVTVIVTTWMLIYHCNKEDSDNLTSNLRIVVIALLAFGAFAIKFSSFPLALFVTLYILFNLGKRKFNRITLLALTLVFSLAPTMAARFVASGYPLCPSTLFGFDSVEWAVDRQVIENATVEIRDFARWQWHTLSSPRYSLGWFDLSWLQYWVKFEILMAAYLVASIFSTLFLIFRRKSELNLFAAIFIGLTGTFYIFISAPFLRLGIGFLVILPSLLLSYLLWMKKLKLAYTAVGIIVLLTSLSVFCRQPPGKFSVLVFIFILLTLWLFAIWSGKRWSMLTRVVIIGVLLCLPMLFTGVAMLADAFYCCAHASQVIPRQASKDAILANHGNYSQWNPGSPSDY
ncbi:hypothetical protein J8C06_04250 [Chloracidobacterium validum]|uniref:DUF8201 domain-containing protein n=1 Tax=Chloracidobacterium validum TaxID=2821543 RepID=A0ABX8BCW0_9BACT|nr:hypothetical protein [Chloracidobacterium validum]QUW03655.1 hypothetical protein J8C06_04250 [Chloracidobacterium validum]